MFRQCAILFHHKLNNSLNSYKGLTILKESLRAAKRPIENVMKTLPSSSVWVGAENKQTFTAIGDKIGCDTALKGLCDVSYRPQMKEENKAFPPPSPPCNVVPLFELPRN